MRVEVLDAGGDVVAAARTFSDGVFYFESLRPGAYRVRVASGWVPFEGAITVAREVTVPASTGPALSLEPLTFERVVH